jgi:IS4 transposase
MQLKDLVKISSPKEVYKKFLEFRYDKYTNIYVSTRKDKKYMVIHPITNKKIHFGSTMQDYTKHKDDIRKNAFLKRNAKWANADKFSPAYLSYNLLWT